MSTATSLTVVCLLLLACNQLADGLACYSCTNCNDPFNPTYIFVQYQNDTVPGYCVKTSIANNIVRSLATTCATTGTSANGVWCCQTNLCNHGQRFSLNHAVGLSVGTLVLLMLF